MDPMVGSGTMIDVANELSRKCIAFDINPVSFRTDIELADARKLPLEDNSVDFVFLHPPYWSMHRYSNPAIEGDLSAMTYDDFLAACKQVLSEACRVVRPGKVIAVLAGAMRKNLKYYDIPSELFFIAREVGLELYDKIVKPIVHEQSNNLHSRLLARVYNFHLIKFETLQVFKKTKPH